MAKTDFQNGTVVTSTFLDSIFLTDGGHKHDGVNDDGHAGRINLASHVEGVLPHSACEPPRGYIDGFITSRSSAQEIAIAPGICLEKDFLKYMYRSAAITKAINSAWAEGDNQGGYAGSGALSANKWYHVFIIGTNDILIDAGFDDDVDGTNLLAAANASGYIHIRRVGSVYYNNSSEIDNFTQIGDWFLYPTVKSETVNLNGTSSGFLETADNMLPPRINKIGLIGSSAPSETGVYGIVHTAGAGASTIPSPTESLHDVGCNASGVKTSVLRKHYMPDSPSGDSRGSIMWKLNTDPSSGTITAYCWGWKDFRGRNILD